MPKTRYDNSGGQSLYIYDRSANVGSSDKQGTNGNAARAWKSNKKSIHWQAAGAESLREVITRLTDNGCGVMFSRTADGGSLVCGVYAGNDRTKEYITDPGDIPGFLSWLLETYG